jgi:hypothetical protein
VRRRQEPAAAASPQVASKIGLANLVYNLRRLVWIERHALSG